MSDRPPRQSGRRRDFASVSEIDSGENGFTRSDSRTLLRPLVRQMKSPREWILPVALSSASILLTSLVLAEFHSHLTAFHVWSDPEDLALAYLLPTIFIAVFFGSTDPPPLKWSDLRYVFDIQEDCNGKEAIQA